MNRNSRLFSSILALTCACLFTGAAYAAASTGAPPSPPGAPAAPVTPADNNNNKTPDQTPPAEGKKAADVTPAGKTTKKKAGGKETDGAADADTEHTGATDAACAAGFIRKVCEELQVKQDGGCIRSQNARHHLALALPHLDALAGSS